MDPQELIKNNKQPKEKSQYIFSNTKSNNIAINHCFLFYIHLMIPDMCTTTSTWCQHLLQPTISTFEKHGFPNPDTCMQLTDDLVPQIKTYCNSHKDIILCMDANKPVTSTKEMQGIGRLTAKTDLIDLQQAWHPNLEWPATYNLGSATIDVCFGSPDTLAAHCCDLANQDCSLATTALLLLI